MARYSLKFLNAFAKASQLSTRVTLKVYGETPMLLIYEIEGMGCISYWVAPQQKDV